MSCICLVSAAIKLHWRLRSQSRAVFFYEVCNDISALQISYYFIVAADLDYNFICYFYLGQFLILASSFCLYADACALVFFTLKDLFFHCRKSRARKQREVLIEQKYRNRQTLVQAQPGKYPNFEFEN